MNIQVDDYLRKIKLLSVDIFDTLLLRLTKSPEMVFCKMFELNRKLFPEDMTDEGWMSIRKGAERRARKNKFSTHGIWDVTIEEIYRNMPNAITNTDELIKKEIAAERLLCYLNPEIYSLILTFNSYNIPIILTSDMYLHREVLLDILQGCGFDINILDDTFVSCDYGSTKRSGDLFRIILDKYKVQPNEVLHIGDNFESDCGMAKSLGMCVEKYSMVSDMEFRNPEMHLEALKYPEMTGALNTIRLLALSKDEDSFWHHLGTSIIGPLLTGFADWVVSYANERNISKIYLMMREGKFLGQLIQNAASQKGNSLEIKKLYISRYAITRSSVQDITEEDINYLCKTHGITVGDVFRTLNVCEKIDKYYKYIDIKTADLDYNANTNHDINCSLDNLLEYLTSEEMISYICEKNKYNGEIFLRYLEQIGYLDGGLSVDVGWKGSLQTMITSFLEQNKLINHTDNLLMCCNPSVVDNLVIGNCIYGYLGNWGSDINGMQLFYPRLLELFLGCDEGTTVGYRMDGNEIVPVLLDIEYPSEQRENIAKLQDGVLTYQRTFYEVLMNLKKCKKPTEYEYLKSYLISQRTEEKDIISRLFSAPLRYEADNLSKLCYDQNYGGNRFEYIIDEYLIDAIKSNDDSAFWGKYQTAQFEWLSGLCVLNDGLSFYKALYLNKASYGCIKMVGMLEEFLKSIGEQHFVLVGAGKNALFIMQYCKALGIDRRIEGIVDNDEVKQQSVLYGYEIHNPGWKFGCGNFLITTLKLGMIRELREDVFRCYGHEIVIGSFI